MKSGILDFGFWIVRRTGPGFALLFLIAGIASAAVTWTPAAPSKFDRITITIDKPGRLHWGVNAAGSSWTQPSSSYWPAGSVAVGSTAVESDFPGPSATRLVIGPFDGTQVVNSVDFVIRHTDGTWDNNSGRDYHIPVAQAAVNRDKPQLEVNGRAGNPGLTRFYLDESKGEWRTVNVKFRPNSDRAIQDVELYTNLDRRDFARLTEDGSSVVAGSPAPTYFKAYDMFHGSELGSYALSMTVTKTGVYRVTVRYKVEGDPNWRWYTSPPERTDHIVVVSPEKARHLSLYELQVQSVEATGDDFFTRSTFEDLTSGDDDGFNPVSIDSLRGLGVNSVWLQPIHPIGSRNEPAPHGQTSDPGSPYAVKNFFAVAEHLSEANTRPGSMTAFQNFVAEADAKGLNVFFDVTFNHAAWDVEVGEGRKLFGWTAWEDAQLRSLRPGWFSRYDKTKPEPDAFRWWERAGSTSEISVAPADRHDFGKWRDVIDFHFGTYPALGNPQTGTDGFWNMDGTVYELVEYFAHYAKFWLSKTGGAGNPAGRTAAGIDGFRCDFAQGLPPQAWEYIINRTRSLKWDFVFMAESLDGGAVSQRAARQFDVINENWVWSTEAQYNPDGWRAAIEARRAEYGSAMILRNIVTHDHPAPEDPWMGAMRTSINAAIDGVPLVFMGMERGYKNKSGFKHFTYEYGRHIYNFKRWNEMTALWNNPVAGMPAFYDRVLSAREASAALQSPNQWFLAQKGGAMHPAILAVAKYEEGGADPAVKDAVVALVNMHYWNEQSGKFDVKIGNNLLGLRDDRRYNVVNLASSAPSRLLWPQARSGKDILENGIDAYFSGGYGDDGRIAQYLKFVDVTDSTPPPPVMNWRDIRIDGNFLDWKADDVIALDRHHDEWMHNDGADYGRDLVALYAAEGRSDYWLRADMLDAALGQENGGLNVCFLLDFKAGGQEYLPDFVAGKTDRPWEVAVVYNNNADVKVFTPDWVNRASSAMSGAAIHSQLDALELGLKKDFLKSLGFQDSWVVNIQCFTYKDGTNQVADAMPDDKPGDGFVNGAVASNAVTGRAKYAAILHANQSLNAGHDIANWIWNPEMKTPAGNPSGYRRTLQTSQAYGMPMNYHISGSLAVTMAHAYNADPMRSGREFISELKAYVDADQSDKPGRLIAGGGFAEQIMPYFENDPATGFNVNAVATDFKQGILRSIFGITYPTRVFWTPERVIRGSTFDDILVDNTTGRPTGFTATVIDHITHLAKWYGRHGAWDPYKLYRINGVTNFVIDDYADERKFWNMDGGLHIGVRERLLEMATHWDQQQVMLVFDDWEAYAGRSFASQAQVNDNPDNWDVTVRWLANHPWIELVALEDVLDRNWTPVELGSNTSLPVQTYSWLLHASENSYDNWYYGSPQEASFFSTIPLLTGSRTDASVNIPNGMRYGDIRTPGTILHETWKRIHSAPGNGLKRLAQFGFISDIYETAWHDEENTNKLMHPDGSWVSPDATWDPTSPWALLAHGHVRQENGAVNAAYWADGVKRGLVSGATVARAEDCDMDGEMEYVLHNDKVYAIFENDGGRLVQAYAYNAADGGLSMVGVPGAYSYYEGEEEGTGGNRPERRVSCFKEMNNGQYANAIYSAAVGSGSITFTSPDGRISKTMTLSGANLRANYRETVDGSLYVRFGLSPNVLDMLYNVRRNVRMTGGAGAGYVEVANAAGGRARLNFEGAALNTTFGDGTPDNSNALMTWTYEVKGDGAFNVSLDLDGSGPAVASGAAAPAAVAGTVQPNLDGVIVYPNPFIPGDADAQNGQEMIAGDFATGIIFDRLSSDVTITIHTARGTKVAEQRVTTGRAQWDAKTLDGRPVGPGIYVAVIRDNTGKGVRIERVAVVR